MGAWAGGVAQLKVGKEQLRDQQRANRELTRRMEASQREYEALRPWNSAARQAAARNVLGAYEPANQLLGEMTGGKYSLDLLAPTQQWPDPRNMQLAAQHQALPPSPMPSTQIGRAPAAAPGWSGVAGSAPRDPFQTAIDNRIRSTQGSGTGNRGGR